MEPVKFDVQDTGLLHYFLKIYEVEELFTSSHVGRSFESFVLEELIKGLHATLVTNWNFSYYRTRNGAEVDLILEGPFGILPIEIKHASTVQRKELRNLSDFIKTHDLPFGMVINQSSEVRWLTENIVEMPIGWL